MNIRCPILPITATRTILPQRVYVGGFRIVDGVVVMNRVHRKPTYKGPAAFA